MADPISATAAAIFTFAKTAIAAYGAKFAAASVVTKIMMVTNAVLTVSSLAAALHAQKPVLRDPMEQTRFTADPDAPRRYAMGGSCPPQGQAVYLSRLAT